MAACVKLMADLDKAARGAIGKLMGTGTSADASDGLGMQEVSQADAAKLMAPTQDKSKRFLKTCPVLAKAAKVGKEVYFHPKNPMRMVIAQAGRSGKYSIEYYRIRIESKEGPRQSPREWPLHILRFKTPKLDTGWKVLPASDWGGE